MVRGAKEVFTSLGNEKISFPWDRNSLNKLDFEIAHQIVKGEYLNILYYFFTTNSLIFKIK